MKKTQNFTKLITTTILALTLNSPINSTAHANDSEVFASGEFGFLSYSFSPVVGSIERTQNNQIVFSAEYHDTLVIPKKIFEFKRFNFGYSAFVDNNLYYKVAGSIAWLNSYIFTSSPSITNSINNTNLFALTVGMGYNTSFYYSPEFSISGYFRNQWVNFENVGNYGIGFSISPLSFKFPVTENISVLLDPLKINISQELINRNPNLVLGLIRSCLHHGTNTYSASLGISYKL